MPRSLIALAGILVAAFAVACAQPTATPPPTAAPATTPATSAPATTPPPAAAATAAPKADPTAVAKTTAPSPDQVEPVVRLGWNFLYNTLDPATSVGFNPRRNEMFEPLVRLEADGNYVGLLADSWRNVNPTTWEFVIRDRSIFHNGQPVRAEDVKFSFDRVLNPANPGLGVAAQVTPTVEEVRVINPTTVHIVTKGPDPLIVGRTTFVSVIPKAYFESLGSDYATQAREFAEKPIGSGPYKLKSYTPGQQLVTEAFTEHPYRKAITREIQQNLLADTASRMAALSSNQIDMAASVPVDQTQSLTSQGNTMTSVPITNMQGLFLDSIDWQGNPVPELSDRRVRIALSHSVDKNAINQALYAGQSTVSNQLPIASVNGHNPQVQGYGYDPARSRALLAEAGFPNGFTMDMEFRTMTSDQQDVAQAVQRSFEQVGVRGGLTFITDSTVSLDKFNGRVARSPLFGFALNSAYGDADAQIGHFRGDARPGLLHFRNADFDAAFIPSQTEVNVERRRQLLQQAVRILTEEAAYLPLMTTVLIYGTNNKVTSVQAADAYPIMDLIYRLR